MIVHRSFRHAALLVLERQDGARGAVVVEVDENAGVDPLAFWASDDRIGNVERASQSVRLGEIMRLASLEDAFRLSYRRDRIFLSRHAAGDATLCIEEQRCRSNMIWRVEVDTTKVSPAFLVRMLNSPFGRNLRRAASSGNVVPLVNPKVLVGMVAPLPPLSMQHGVMRLHADLAALAATVSEGLRSLDEDLRRFDRVRSEVEAMKGIVDLDGRISDWWRELPYPLATIYRRRQVAKDPKERFEAALHFFEAFSVYLAAIGVSHLRMLGDDAFEFVGRLLDGGNGSNLRRTSFGFWVKVAGRALVKLGDPTTYEDAGHETTAGLSVASAAQAVAALEGATPVLHQACELRNRYKGHGGLLKSSDAATLDAELDVLLRELYAKAAATLRRTTLVRVGRCEVRRGMNVYEADVLQGSDSIFDHRSVETRQVLESGSLALLHDAEEFVAGDVPFFRVGTPRDPAEPAAYVYSRRDGEGLRWVSFQPTRDQEIVMGDRLVEDLMPRR